VISRKFDRQKGEFEYGVDLGEVYRRRLIAWIKKIFRRKRECSRN